NASGFFMFDVYALNAQLDIAFKNTTCALKPIRKFAVIATHRKTTNQHHGLPRRGSYGFRRFYSPNRLATSGTPKEKIS
ncbi:hypothetical protein, partial [Pseudomonas syringae]